jgi:membrane protein DedA with SNARE-associated domain
VLAHIASFITTTITHLGYPGIVALMAIESACIPLPSEVIMPFSGYLVATGTFTLWGVALAGAVGSVVGSMVAYGIGAWGGRPLAERYGTYVLVSKRDLEQADRWFTRWGDATILVGRVLPVVRTFLGLPAGISRMNLWRYNAYTFLGSFVWCLALAWIGRSLGAHWHTLGGWFHRFDAVIVAAVVLVVAAYVWRHLRQAR